MKYTLFASLIILSFSVVAEEFSVEQENSFEITIASDDEWIVLELGFITDWNYLSTTPLEQKAQKNPYYQVLGGWKIYDSKRKKGQDPRHINLSEYIKREDGKEGKLTLYNWGKGPISGTYYLRKAESEDEEITESEEDESSSSTSTPPPEKKSRMSSDVEDDE